MKSVSTAIFVSKLYSFQQGAPGSIVERRTTMRKVLSIDSAPRGRWVRDGFPVRAIAA